MISSIVNLFDSDKSKYVRMKGPGADNVLVLNGMMKNGQPITVRVAANKNNKALDVMIGDAWLDIEGQYIGDSRHTKQYPHLFNVKTQSPRAVGCDRSSCTIKRLMCRWRGF